jgi:hypothetical protein
MKEEPTVLDYIKARLTPWRGAPPAIPLVEQAGEPVAEHGVSSGPDILPVSQVQAAVIPAGKETEIPAAMQMTWPWFSMAGLGLAIFAQLALEPRPGRSWEAGVALYLFAIACLVWAYWHGEWALAAPPDAERRIDSFSVRNLPFLIGIGLSLLGFLLMGENRFNSLNLLFWLSGLGLVVWSFWLNPTPLAPLMDRLSRFLAYPRLQINIPPQAWLVIAAVAVILFFRLYQLNDVPPQMVSDHREKLQDVGDVLRGETRIFFPRNTGREPMQMYLTAAVIHYFDTGISFLSLKIGTVLAGLLTLPFIYLLGREVANNRVGLLAMFFAGIAYWPNVISRLGLRFPLYPLFVAPALYFLIRGLRRSSRNDFILAGIFLGIGLHGYTPIRILPVVILVAIGLFLLHRQPPEARRQAVWGLTILVLVSLIAFLPLLRYSMDDPGMFGYRAFSRLGTVERSLPGPALEIFASNLGRALTMFSWNNGQIWPVSVTHRPALDVVSGALFHLGLALLFLRYIHRRHWLDLFLLLSIPLLMMPSILSLAFPDENPALNRTAGALVPVFIIIALGLDGFLTGIKNRLGPVWGTRLAVTAGLLLMLMASSQNYDLVFRQYRSAYEAAAWNTTEMGQVIRNFAGSVGRLENAWVLAYPHWADTQLVGIHAGDPDRDYAISLDQLPETTLREGPRLFLVNINDEEGLATLEAYYPEGWRQMYFSIYENKDFWMFFVPPEGYQP